MINDESIIREATSILTFLIIMHNGLEIFLVLLLTARQHCLSLYMAVPCCTITTRKKYKFISSNLHVLYFIYIFDITAPWLYYYYTSSSFANDSDSISQPYVASFSVDILDSALLAVASLDNCTLFVQMLKWKGILYSTGHLFLYN